METPTTYHDITIEFQMRTSEDMSSQGAISESSEEYSYYILASIPGMKEPLRRDISLEPVLSLIRESSSIDALSKKQLEGESDAARGERMRRRKELCSELRLDKELGLKLYNSIFEKNPDVKGLLDYTRGKASKEGIIRLKIKADLDKYPEIGCLPWELMYDPTEWTKGYLSVDLETSFIRYVPVNELTEPEELAAKPEVVIVIANPGDFGGGNLNTAEERDGILKKIGTLASKVTILDSSLSETEIQDEIRHTYPDAEFVFHTDVSSTKIVDLFWEEQIKCDIFHFIGHATFEEVGEVSEGRLVVEEEGNPNSHELISSDDFSFWFKSGKKEHGFPQLVFLNGCNTATHSARNGDSPFTGLATALIQEGFPAILAMQREVKYKYAILFANSFYAQLKQTKDLVKSTHEARQMIAHHEKKEGKRTPEITENEWAIPVLFLRS